MSTVATHHFQKKPPVVSISWGKNLAETGFLTNMWWEISRYFLAGTGA
jgi:hypothetical protein